MNEDAINDLLERINTLPNDWHGAGTVTHDVLTSIVELSRHLQPIKNSMETGSGRTTLLLSHLSKKHTVFAIDMDRSITRVRESELFNATTANFIEAPTQTSLPLHSFLEPLDLVLIDGPHGYPFPDLEYYFVYPHVREGGLLIVDDIKIPSIGRMKDIIAAGPAFELIKIVSDNTAFFRRTKAPCTDPNGDDWWLQGYNAAYYEQLMAPRRPSAVGPLLQWFADRAPLSIQQRVPSGLKRRLVRMIQG